MTTTAPAPADRATGVLAFREGVDVDVADGLLRVTGGGTPFAVRGVGDLLAAALRRLTVAPVPADELLDSVPAAERAVLRRFLDHAEPLLEHGVLDGGRPVARLEHLRRAGPFRPAALPDTALVRLSAFAFCRTREGALVLESPLATHRAVLLSGPARALVADLGAPRPVGSLRPAVLVAHLVAAGLVEVAGPDGTFASDTDPVLRQWDFHDLLMHSRIRSGRYDDPFGALYPYRGEIEPRSAVRPPPDGPSVALPRPTWDELQARDALLSSAMEGRRSIRHYRAEPITLAQLGEFLYRVARVRAHFTPEPGTDEDEVVSRPHPSGGRANELELWLSVRRCTGLGAGVYYYDPVAHRLVLVNDSPADRDAMLAVATRATGVDCHPDVLVTMTSRFQRLSWKYRGMAYATTLRHTGVLYQSMYLVAAAMGLGVCGLGAGDADLASRVLGTDYLSESSVGDLALGVRAPDDRIGGPPPAGWRLLNDPEWPVQAAAQLP